MVRYASWDFNKNSITQLLDIAGQDSTKYESIFKLHESTVDILNYLEELENSLIEVTGGHDANGSYMNPNEIQLVQDLMITDGKAKELKLRLDQYSKRLEILGLKKNRIAAVPQKNIMLRNDPRFHESNFEQLHFSNTKMIDCLTAIENYKMQILVYEGLTINLELIKICAP